MIRDQAIRPANMGNIVTINQGKASYAASEPAPAPLTPADAKRRTDEGAILLDVRPSDSFGKGHIAGSLGVNVSHGSFEQWVGWILPAGDVILVVEKPEDAALAAHKLAFVGLDSRVRAFLPIGAWREAGLSLVELPEIDATELERRIAAERIPVLDVRDDSEWDGGHVASAVHGSFKTLPQMLDRLPVAKDQEFAVMCAGGLRSVIASSILRRAGYSRLINVKGGITAWRRAGLPTTTS